jgi:glycerate kinase
MTVAGIPTTVLLAPDSFKGTFSSTKVAAALAAGLEAAGRPVDLCPVADGGEGTLTVLRDAMGADAFWAKVHDPLGREVQAELAIADAGRTAIVEAAAAAGLGLLAPGERDPIAASSFGVGELIAAGVDAGAERILLGVGGTATTDGGSGAIRALRRRGGLRDAELVVLSDVRTPFEDAARVFGPQKGAAPEDVRRLARRLRALAGRFPRDPRARPMTGAAGGLAGGLWAAFDARLVSGAAFVLDALDFDARMRRARAVVTGEGQLDLQSLSGKLVSEVATRARQAGVPCHAVVGRRELDDFGLRVLDVQAVLEASTLRQIEAAGRKLADLL